MTHLYFEPQTLPKLASGGVDVDSMIPQMLTQNLPEWLMALIILLILSASMSTLSSLILVAAGAVAIDLYKGHVNPDIPKESSLVMIRFLSAIFIAFSWIIAYKKIGFIVTLMALSWGVVAGAFMAAFIYSLYWRRTTAAGVMAGMLTALLITIGCALKYYIDAPDTWLDAYQKFSTKISCVAMLAPFVVVPLVSLCTKAPEAALLDKAFAPARKEPQAA
jgi:SSS family solute:Na+ symporter